MQNKAWSFNVDPDTLRKLREMAEAEQRTQSAQVRVLIAEAYARFMAKQQVQATVTVYPVGRE